MRKAPINQMGRGDHIHSTIAGGRRSMTENGENGWILLIFSTALQSLFSPPTCTTSIAFFITFLMKLAQ